MNRRDSHYPRTFVWPKHFGAGKEEGFWGLKNRRLAALATTGDYGMETMGVESKQKEQTMNLFAKHGGYRKLDSFTLATVIQLGTWRFCERFLDRKNDPCGRQFDQMTQAARSGRANIVEGSERAGTSRGRRCG
jgi:hypothetical protein